MEKVYDRIDWVNNTTPALNQTNLNRMSKAVDDIDDRVVDIAGTVMETVPQVQEDLAEAQELLEDAEAISTHPPIIGQNGNWWTWDTSIDDYADSGVDAGVSLTIGTTSTLSPGSDATVENVGTDTDPILNFGIPQGVAGQNGQDGADGQDGISPEVTIGPITGGHSVTITDADHPTGQTFNVMDGTNGQGVPASGTTGQVLTKASNADYDTTWTTPSGGSGGHTILNGSGSAMTQRTNLQFDGADVTDDSANDKTIVKTTPRSMIGDAWVASHVYAVGDYCIDGNGLYKCKTAHTSSLSNRPLFDTSYWDAVSVASQLGAYRELFGSEINILPQLKDATHDVYGQEVSHITITVSGTGWGSPYMALQRGVNAYFGCWISNVGNAYWQYEQELMFSAKRISGALLSSSGVPVSHTLTCAIKFDGNWITLPTSQSFPNLPTRHIRYFYFDIDYSTYPAINGFKIMDSTNGDMSLANLTVIPY